MDHEYVRKHDVIDRFLLGQLSESEERAFERYYFEHPDVLKEVAIARSMRDSLRSISASNSKSARAPDAQRPAPLGDTRHTRSNDTDLQRASGRPSKPDLPDEDVTKPSQRGKSPGEH